MPTVKAQVKQETSLEEFQGGRSNSTESSARGRAKHATDASLVCSLCDGQRRREKLPALGLRGGGNSMYVPVVSSTGKPLMPCHPARARELVQRSNAIRRFSKGIFYIRLLERKDGDTQSIAIGVDPGSKKEGFSVKSKAHTYLNIEADAVTWVKEHVKVRSQMRRARRFRNTPCRANRSNRSIGGIPPSIKARWQWKLRICWWLSKLFPITRFVVEDIKAWTKKGQGKWNCSFSPLEVGKKWFYKELSKLGDVTTLQGYETKELRGRLGLTKTHWIDGWVLAYSQIGGELDNQRVLNLTPLRFHRRQLHALQPAKGGIRRLYGGTISLVFKRGSCVKHPKWGLCYVGGFLKDRLSLHSLLDGKRLTQNAKSEDLKFLTYSSWRVQRRPLAKARDEPHN